jgi:predicted Fe-Mo cluster-binding NifX family protein
MYRIAVTSQNFRTITPHAGRTRRFLVYRGAPGGDPELVDRLDLPKQQALHDWGNKDGHPIFEMDAVLCGSCGHNFVAKLAKRGVEAVPTDETDPERAIRDYLTGQLSKAEVHTHTC